MTISEEEFRQKIRAMSDDEITTMLQEIPSKFLFAELYDRDIKKQILIENMRGVLC